MLQRFPEGSQERQPRVRRFEAGDEARLLSASAAFLQDLGFTIIAHQVA